MYSDETHLTILILLLFALFASLMAWQLIDRLQARVSVLEHLLDRATERVIDQGYQLYNCAPQGRSGLSSGWVYILRSASGEYKIGRTKNPEDRLATFAVKLPFRVEYDCLIFSRDTVALESHLHQQFGHKYLDGEWFALNETDLSWLGILASASGGGHVDGD
jgi:hypothetical protein